MQKPKRRIPRFSNNRVIAPTHTALALKLVTGMDLLRLKSIARLYARGLPPEVAWDDLLQEAMTRMLTGSRLKPDDVPIVAFLAGVMRSLRADHLRRARIGVKLDESWLAAKGSQDREALDPRADPERALIAVEELEKIRLLFADDRLARQIIDGLAEGLDAEQIRLRFDISRKDYDSARRRMRRCLLREGLTCRKT